MRGGMISAGGGGDCVRFQRGAYTYTVYSEFGQGWEREGALVAGEGWARLYKAKLLVDENRVQES
jgi:hypothetical protein